MTDDFEMISDTAESEAEVSNESQERAVAAQTDTDSSHDSDGRDSAVENQETHVNGGGDGSVHRQQSREENAQFKAMRLRAAKEAEANVRKAIDDEFAESGVVNPYTGEPFKSMAEFREYGERYRKEQLEEQSKQTGRSVSELAEEDANRRYLSRKRKEEQEQKNAQKTRNDEQSRLLADALEFQERFPDVDLVELENNPRFRKFAGKRLYAEPIAELYADYSELMGEASEVGAAKSAAKRMRGTGGGSGSAGVILSPNQQASLDAWNRANPDMRMTAKEFLDR